MRQLTGLDTSFLNMETPTTYGHVCGLAVFDPSTAPGPIGLDDLKRLVEERLHLVPPYRRRLVEVPFGLDHPYWIEDPNFDIDFHVRHIGLPPPGDARQLGEQVSRLVARPLDRSRPLWELYLIEGLEGGYIAQLTKIHHCLLVGFLDQIGLFGPDVLGLVGLGEGLHRLGGPVQGLAQNLALALHDRLNAREGDLIDPGHRLDVALLALDQRRGVDAGKLELLGELAEIHDVAHIGVQEGVAGLRFCLRHDLDLLVSPALRGAGVGYVAVQYLTLIWS